MLHELLLALYGIEGSVFTKLENSEFGIVKDLPFVSPSEEALMTRICTLGSTYSRLEVFIEYNARPISVRNCGLYKSALAFALSDSLECYRTDLSELELEILEDPHKSLTSFQCRLEKYNLIFPVLLSIVDNIVKHKLHGCQILDVIQKNISSGLLDVPHTLMDIMQACNRVLFRQLSAWMLRGLLLDQYGEFFIQSDTTSGDQGELLETYEQSSNELPIIDEYGKSQIELLSNIVDLASLKHKFIVRVDMLPSYIPISLGEQILFIGESVHLFNSNPDNKDQNRNADSLVSILEKEFANKLFMLGVKREFSLLNLQELVECIRKSVNYHLWTLLVEENHLIKHLTAVKDIYLFGRGGPTALNSKLEGDFVPYNVRWPFHIIFPESILKKYSSVYEFLLLIRKTQLALQNCWALQMLSKRQSNEGKVNPRKWLLRSHMAFLIDNLQYYLQADVIDSQFSELIKKIVSTKDIEKIQIAHHFFITSIEAQSFFFNKPIYNCLVKICNLCLEYSSNFEKNLDPNQSKDFEAQSFTIQKNFQHESSLLFNTLSNVHDQLQSGPYLAQLLLRLDFNGFYSSAGGKLG